MANIELNIVALGDFSSVNAQIKALQAQVALLQQGMAGVGVNSTLAKDLNNITNSFKQTMLSTGQFTASTVQMSSETEKFGQALQKGSLGIGNYFNILTNRTSAATDSVKALAVEQTKLQNSVIMSDPTKQGFYSVFTPTTINAVANATKIAANEQNIYNIAVEKGSQALINWGKNTQWAGRQLTVGMSMPLILFGQQAIASFDSVNKAITQLQKVYGEGLTPPSQNSINQISQQVLDLGRNMASTLGITQEFTVQVASSFAAMGKMGTDLTTATEQTVRLAKLGNLDQQTATSAVIALQNVYKLNTTQLSDAVNYFGAIQKQTSLSMNDLVTAESKVGPIIDQLGGSYKDTSVMLLAMKEAGVPAAQAANALKSAFGSIIAPTAAANKEFMSFGINLDSIKNAGGPVQVIQALQASLQNLSPLVKEQLIEKLFGKYQFSRISALIDNFGKVGSQTANAIKVANASSEQIQNLANQELTQATSTPSAQWTKAMATIKADLYPVGQKLVEFGTKILQFGNGIAKLFQGLPGPVKAVMGALAIGVALSGPIIMLTGLFANFVGYVIKGIFNLKQLATGGKTLGQLLTPEMIAAQNASKLFGDGIASDVDEIDLLNTAIKQLTVSMQELISSMNQGAGISTLTEAITSLDSVATAEAAIPDAIRNIPFKAPGMATGGFVPGSGNSDSYPAMLTPGEAVIPKDMASKYGPFISAMIDGSLPGYSKGNKAGRGGSGRIGKSLFTLSEQHGTNIAQGENTVSISNIEPNLANVTDLYAPSIMAESGTNRSQINAEIDAWKKENAPAIEAATKAWRNGATESEAFAELTKKFASDMEAANGPVHSFITTAKTMFPKLQADLIEAQEYVKTFNLNLKNAADTAQLSKALPNNILATGINTPGPFQTFAKTRAASTAILSGSDVYAKTGVPRFMASGINDPSDPLYNGLMSQGHFSRSETQAQNLAKQQQIRNSKNEEMIAQELDRASQSASPSRATRKAAQNMVDGVTTAIEDGKPKVTQAIYNNWIPQEEEAAVTTGEETASKSGGILGRATNFMSGGAMGGGVAGGMGAGMTAMMMGQMASPLLKNIPGVGGAASAGVGDASSIFGLMSMIPGIGMEAKLAITAVTGGLGIAKSAITSLMAAERQHKAESAASFGASSDAITMFGSSVNNASTNIIAFTAGVKETAPELTALQQNVQAISKLSKDNPFKMMAEDLKGLSSSSSIIGTLKQFSASQVMNGLDPSKVKDMVTALLSYTGQTQYLDAALKEIIPSTQSAATATDTWFKKINPQVGLIDLNAKSLSQLSQVQQQYSKGLLQIVTTQIESGSSAQQIKQTYDSLTTSIKDQAGAYQGLILAAQQAGQAGLASSLQMSQSYGLSIAQATLLAQVTQTMGGNTPMDAKSIAKALADPARLAATYEDNVHKTAQAAVNVQAAAVGQAQTLQSLQEQKKVVDAQLKDEKDKEASIKAQNQFLLSQTDLDNQIRTATASGDFLQAALLRQQKASNAYDYATSNNVSPLQAKSDSLAQKIADAQDASAQTQVQAANIQLQAAKTAADASAKGTPAYNLAIQTLIPILKAIAEKLTGQPIDLNIPDFTNAPQVLGPDKKRHTTTMQHGKGYAVGGLILGPGTSTSDSINTMLSNGEFVTSASAVSKYGVSFMNSINNGSYRPSLPNMAGASSLSLANSGTVGGSVYNITVNAQTSANTDEIVKAVVNSVKRLEGMSSSNRTVRV